MSTRYKIRDEQHLYFLSFAVVAWVDVFTRRAYKDIFLDSLKHCQIQKGLELYAFCIMPNHVHLLAGVKEGSSLSDVLRDLKKFTAYAIIKAIEEHPQESRRDWMLWIFRKHGERNSNNTRYQRTPTRQVRSRPSNSRTPPLPPRTAVSRIAMVEGTRPPRRFRMKPRLAGRASRSRTNGIHKAQAIT